MWTDRIEAAAARIEGHARRTPVMRAQLAGHDVELKLENVQHAGSFKARGAFNSLLARDVPGAGVVAASGGNHGAAVAHAAGALGVPAAIYVPEIAGPAKIGLIRAQGVEPTVVPGAYADAAHAARAHRERTGAMEIHPYDDAETVEGQGTLMREWEAQGLEADTVLIAVGGGGLMAGALAWLGGRRRVVAVEPERSRALHAALEAGAPVDVEVGGVAANALGARRIGEIPFGLAREAGACVALVSDEAILEARALLWTELRQWVEPAGAAALAALVCGAYVPQQGERVAVLVCGANPTEDPLA